MKFFLPIIFSAFLVHLTQADERPAKPNVVLILTDDLGWQDVKCYDADEPSVMETPNLDSLAKRGVLFWQAYSPAPTCAPSRCAIMSGNHPARAQKTHVVGRSASHTEPQIGLDHDCPMVQWPDAGKRKNHRPGSSGLRIHDRPLRKMAYGDRSQGVPSTRRPGFRLDSKQSGPKVGHEKPRHGVCLLGKKDPFRLDENGFLIIKPARMPSPFCDKTKPSLSSFIMRLGWYTRRSIRAPKSFWTNTAKNWECKNPRTTGAGL